MRKKIIAGNWKMNLNTHQASLYLHKLDQAIDAHRSVEIVLLPSTLTLQSLSLQINHRKFKLGAQNCYWRDDGAFTGEVSASQLSGVVSYVLTGHSERRHLFGETDNDVKQKVQAVMRNNMTPIVCIGETAAEKVANETQDVLHGQLLAGLANVTSEEIKHVVIAYEPVWAISNGKDYKHHELASPEDAGKMATFIRHQIASLYGSSAAQEVRILYGASANKNNAKGFLTTEGIDGLLVGGASLHAEEFSAIVQIAYELENEKKKSAHPGVIK